jgi:hypothetical protein
MIFWIIIVILAMIFIILGAQYIVNKNEYMMLNKNKSSAYKILISQGPSNKSIQKFKTMVPEKYRRLLLITKPQINYLFKEFDQDKIFIPSNTEYPDNCGYKLKNVPNSSIVFVMVSNPIIMEIYCINQLNKDLKNIKSNSKYIYLISSIKNTQLLWSKIEKNIIPSIKGVFLSDNSNKFKNILKWSGGNMWNIGEDIYISFPLNEMLDLDPERKK